MKKINEIYIKKKQKLIMSDVVKIEEEPIRNNEELVATVINNMSSLGYLPSEELLNLLKRVDRDDLVIMHDEIIDTVQSIVGDRGDMTPKYVNFPLQVMSKTESTLYIESLLYYLSNGEITPFEEKVDRPLLLDMCKATIIDIGSLEDFKSIFTNLTGSKAFLSRDNYELLDFFFEEFDTKELFSLISENVYSKEIRAYLFTKFHDKGLVASNLINTATDLLRIIVSMSGGSVSLSGNVSIKSFSRRDRRMFLNILNGLETNVLEDMLRYRSLWLKVGEKLHPGEYKNRYLTAYEYFNTLRNGKIVSFNSKKERLISENKKAELVKLLSKRPGEYARSLDLMLRMDDGNGNDKVLDIFGKVVAPKLETPLLWQLKTHFSNRNEEVSDRVFIPKGEVSKVFVIENNLPKIKDTDCRKVQVICENVIRMKYVNKEEISEAVYISEDLKDYTIPLTTRNYSEAMKAVGRGSRLKLKDTTKNIRPFLYWNNDYTDVDLSAIFYNEDFEMKSRVAYYQLKDDNLEAYHSGDITNGTGGATEYIDLDLKVLKDKGIRYVAIAINSYSRENFEELNECFVGYMERENPLRGKIFEPKTVENRIDLAGKSQGIISQVIDVENREIIWVDMSASVNRSRPNNVDANKDVMAMTVKSVVNSKFPNLYELFRLNVEARGGLIVEDIEEAEKVIGIEGDITPFDIDDIISNYL